jgi:hypothetical protein
VKERGNRFLKRLKLRLVIKEEKRVKLGIQIVMLKMIIVRGLLPASVEMLLKVDLRIIISMKMMKKKKKLIQLEEA